MMEIQEDILKIPDLSVNQKDDIIELRERLEELSLQMDDAKIKLALVDVMNKMN